MRDAATILWQFDLPEHFWDVVLAALGIVSSIVGWIFVRAVSRYDKTVEKVDRHEIQIDRAISSIHSIEDTVGLDRTSFSD